jgi:hypothetical protein
LRCTVDATGGGGTVESKVSVSPGSYTVTVGAGGAGANNAGSVTGGNGGSGIVIIRYTII